MKTFILLLLTLVAIGLPTIADTIQTLPLSPPPFHIPDTLDTTVPIKVNGLDITADQYDNLVLAKEIAANHYTEVHVRHPYTKQEYMLLVMSILWQESKAGKYGPVGDIKNGFGKRSYGLMQIKYRTANKMLHLNAAYSKQVFGKPNPTEEEVIAALIYNKRFNITIGCLYLNFLHDKHHISLDNMITAYNNGYTGAKKNHFRKKQYTKTVMHTMTANKALVKVK